MDGPDFDPVLVARLRLEHPGVDIGRAMEEVTRRRDAGLCRSPNGLLLWLVKNRGSDYAAGAASSAKPDGGTSHRYALMRCELYAALAKGGIRPSDMADLILERKERGYPQLNAEEEARILRSWGVRWPWEEAAGNPEDAGLF